ncbi:hypothetical protein F4809DRAFT_602334 [Biscogniauxia mediterranea]|nr:hypothetical protein F4809DRAFT_602334 [Biscogniauxia mediterranea]
MAAPANKTIGDLNGKWHLNKTLSDPVEPVLALQGVGWFIRKAVSAAGITLHVKHYLAEGDDAVPHVDITQVATGGIQGTTENRTADYEFREHSDWLFGAVRGRCKFVTPEELAEFLETAAAEGWVDPSDRDFLARDWLPASEAERAGAFGQGKPLFLSHVESIDAGWTATQVWGFQDVGGERRYTRNVVAANKGRFVAIKMVYDWVPE